MKDEFRIRTKGKGKFVVQKNIAGVWATRTLSPQKIWEILEMSENVSNKVSEPTQEQSAEKPQRYSQDLLSEQEKVKEFQTQVDKILKDILK